MSGLNITNKFARRFPVLHEGVSFREVSVVLRRWGEETNVWVYQQR